MKSVDLTPVLHKARALAVRRAMAGWMVGRWDCLPPHRHSHGTNRSIGLALPCRIDFKNFAHRRCVASREPPTRKNGRAVGFLAIHSMFSDAEGESVGPLSSLSRWGRRSRCGGTLDQSSRRAEPGIVDGKAWRISFLRSPRTFPRSFKKRSAAGRCSSRRCGRSLRRVGAFGNHVDCLNVPFWSDWIQFLSRHVF